MKHRNFSSIAVNAMLAIACLLVMAGGLYVSGVFSGRSEPAAEADRYISASDGYAFGEIGNFMRNVFFDFRVNSAESSETYADLKAGEGKKYVIVNVTVSNPASVNLPMFDTDFQLIYGDGEDDWEVPETYYDAGFLREGMLESEYILAPSESVSGDLVFSVPSVITECHFVYEEYFDNGETGDLYSVALNVK